MHRHLPAILLFLVAHPGVAAAQDLHAWKWQRSILPAATGAEQCVVLDGELFAHAAPGLRDLRVLQQGREVPYALEESFDESAVSHPTQDRGLYAPVLRIPIQPIDAAAAESDQHLSPVYRGQAVLAAHVPVERMQLEPDTNNASQQERLPIPFTLAATPQPQFAGPQGVTQSSEVIHGDMPSDAPVEITAIGANLQSDAIVSVTVFSRHFAAVLLQMRRRLLCVRPTSNLPMRMVFGNDQARSVQYNSMTHYRASLTPVLAQMGPVQVNPAYRSPLVRAPLLTLRRLVLLAGICLVATVLIAVLPMLTEQR